MKYLVTLMLFLVGCGDSKSYKPYILRSNSECPIEETIFLEFGRNKDGELTYHYESSGEFLFFSASGKALIKGDDVVLSIPHKSDALPEFMNTTTKLFLFYKLEINNSNCTFEVIL